MSKSLSSYKVKVNRLLKERKTLAKSKYTQQGGKKYEMFLQERFVYPLLSAGHPKSVGVTPCISKFTEAVVGELSSQLGQVEPLICEECGSKEKIQKEINLLKRKEETLVSTCQAKS